MRCTNIIANQIAMNPSAEDLRAIGVQAPGDLVGKNPVELYDRLGP